MHWVVDCCFTAALFLPDESSEKVRTFFMGLTSRDQLHVPALWWLETANVLTAAERRKRITARDVQHVLSLLNGLALETDHTAGVGYAQTLNNLAGQFGLAAYDATYLELAQRKSAGLATLDRQLREAARKAGLDMPTIQMNERVVSGRSFTD